MNKKLLVIVLILASISLVGCSSNYSGIEKSLTTKVENATEEFNITDAKITVEYVSDYNDKYKNFKIFVESEEFENLDIKDKYDFMTSFDGGDSSTNTLITGIVTSNNNTYEVESFPDKALIKNNQVVYTHEKYKPLKEEGRETVSYEKEASEDDKGYSWAVALNEVEKILKSPSTAEFPSSYLHADIKEVNTNTFVVKSYVDAENSFGAKIRTDFMVKYERTGENNYKVLDIQIYE